MAWRIEFDAGALKDLHGLDRQVARRITRFLRERLAQMDDPRSLGAPLRSPASRPEAVPLWRYRVGDGASWCGSRMRSCVFSCCASRIAGRSTVARLPEDLVYALELVHRLRRLQASARGTQGALWPISRRTTNRQVSALMRTAGIEGPQACMVRHPYWWCRTGTCVEEEETSPRQQGLGEIFGELDDSDMVALNRALALFVGIAS